MLEVPRLSRGKQCNSPNQTWWRRITETETIGACLPPFPSETRNNQPRDALSWNFQLSIGRDTSRIEKETGDLRVPAIFVPSPPRPSREINAFPLNEPNRA